MNNIDFCISRPIKIAELVQRNCIHATSRQLQYHHQLFCGRSSVESLCHFLMKALNAYHFFIAILSGTLHTTVITVDTASLFQTQTAFSLHFHLGTLLALVWDPT